MSSAYSESSLYREFGTTQELDLQYSPSLTVADAASFGPAFIDASERFLSTSQSELGLRFGATRDEYLDLHFPAGHSRDGQSPVALFIHGGYWRSFNARDFAFVASGLVERGYIVVVPNYALLPHATLAEIVAQMRAAVAWTHHNIGAWGGDPGRLVVTGHSAGGHLSAMVAITDWSRYDIMGQPLAGVVPISGLFDLGPFPHSFLASSLQLTASDMRRLSPQFAQLPPSLPPMAVTWGGLETSEFRRQSIDFTDRLTAAGHGAHAIAIDDTHHFTVVQELADPDGMLCNLICGFAEA